jgi:hypothetical protein
MLKVGEKVRYLNDVGEATVKRILSATTVEVEDQFGLVHPHPINQLVPANRNREATVETAKKVIEKAILPADLPVEPIIITSEQQALPELALVFVSDNATAPETGDLDLYFVNNSAYHILVNISAKEEIGLFSLFHGKVKSGDIQMVRPIRRHDVDIFGTTMVDCVFFQDADYQHREAFSACIKLKATRFVRSGNYVPIVEFGGMSMVVAVQQAPKISNVLPPSTSSSAPNRVVRKSSDLQVFEEEVDLHIEQLTSEFGSMSDHEMFTVQMRHFENRLNYGLTNDYVKITFIHGVGTGRLRDAIRNVLQEYKLKFEDGAFQKYGVGATSVNLK